VGTDERGRFTKRNRVNDKSDVMPGFLTGFGVNGQERESLKLAERYHP
jgi:hypothetical protein